MHRQGRQTYRFRAWVHAIAPLALGIASIQSCGGVGESSSGPSSGSSSESEACRAVGRYEVGKEGGYEPCCEGLHEISTLKASYGTEGEVVDCQDAELNLYACILGTCGDGICEPAEDDCGCMRDCGGPTAR